MNEPNETSARLLSKIRKDYKQNEDENAHAENLHLLALHFGTEEEQRITAANVDFKERKGYTDSNLSRDAYHAANHYYAKIK